MFLFHEKTSTCLARPNFLTGVIIETRSQASLPAPPPLPRSVPDEYNKTKKKKKTSACKTRI